ncbi:MAG: hypothetical protein R2854_03280 [Caldilineaceae bacterium]
MAARLRRIRTRLDQRLGDLLSRGLPPTARIRRAVLWPLLLLPLFLVNQLLTPHPVWMVLILFIAGIYGAGYWWVRALATSIELTRTQRSAILVAGDTFAEEFVLANRSRVPVLWAEVVDASTLPDYAAGRVVAAGAGGQTRWRTGVECRTRGVYRIGPAVVNSADPFGLFRLELDCPATDSLLIYPRVLQLPPLALPRAPPAAWTGAASPHGRAARPAHASINGAIACATSTGPPPPTGASSSSRNWNWSRRAMSGSCSTWTRRSTQGRATPALWNTPSSWRPAPRLRSSTGRSSAVGLLAVSGGATDTTAPDASTVDVVRIPPQPSRAQLWRIMAALAPVRPTDVTLARLLHQNADTLGRRRSLVLITPQPPTAEATWSTPAWLPELLRIQAAGLAASALLVAQDADLPAADVTRTALAQLDVPAQVLPVSAKLPPLVTYRRKRTVYRTTPTGGVVVQEIEEEVG